MRLSSGARPALNDGEYVDNLGDADDHEPDGGRGRDHRHDRLSYHTISRASITGTSALATQILGNGAHECESGDTAVIRAVVAPVERPGSIVRPASAVGAGA